MTATLLTIFGGMLGKLALIVLEKLVFKGKSDAEARKVFLEFSRLLNERGIVDTRKRYAAEDQIDNINKGWKGEA